MKESKKNKSSKKNINKKSLSKNQSLAQQNKELADELGKLKDEKLRLIADFENFKKRKINEISNLLKYSGEEIIKSLIPVFDDLDRILEESDNIKDEKTILEGLKIINTKLFKILEKLGIIKFSAKGNIFDPNVHDAMMVRKSKENKNVIIEEFEKGYRYYEKIIKHSKVIVSKGK